jgi:uncharacterized glyoxalase superfamily protein PhnB
MYRKVAPMLLIENVDQATAYYQEIFEAKLQYSLPKTSPYESVSLLLGDAEIMFWQKEAAQREYPGIPLTSGKGGNLILYVYVEEVDNLHDCIKDKVTVLGEPENQSYGIREFTLQDCFDFVLTFAEITQK